MCGIAGLVGNPRPDLERIIQAMTDCLRHRGPDGGGSWCEPERGLALGHRRLAILDPSPAGKQPMLSASQRYVLVCNGEIYNFRQLREQLSQPFRGHSDSEVVLAAMERWGIEGALERFQGMFALALWDRVDKQLTLARDRLGKKPLYYGFLGSTLVFSSELKALRLHPDFSCSLNPEALALFLQYSNVPGSHCIFAGLHKLEPAHFLVVDCRQRPNIVRRQRYWIPRLQPPLSLSSHLAEESLLELLRDAVRLRLQSDVPLGAFLSGGIDSSLVVALAQEQGGQPLQTFAIGFRAQSHDEAPQARAVAEQLGCDHHEHYVTARQALEVIPRLPLLYDEPFADSSQIPTYILSCLARSQVTVALSGDGGDEVFCGYPRYAKTLAGWNRLARWPAPLRELLRGVLALAPKGLPRWRNWRGALGCRSLQQLYRRTMSQGLDLRLPPTAWDRDHPGLEPYQKLSLLDLESYLPDDILVKVDRASMGVGLEVRSPLLDYRVVEFGLRLPPDLKSRGGIHKRLLRMLLGRYLPERLWDRPKHGFSIPLAGWLRNPLRPWAEELLSTSALVELDAVWVRRLWSQHLSGVVNHAPLLWNILMFQQWIRNE